MTTFSYSTDAPATVRAGVLVLPMYSGPKGPLAGPGVKEVGLEQAYRDAKLTGKKQENLLVVRRDGDRFAAGAAMLVGVGDKAELTPTALRRVLGRVAGTLGRFGTAATTFPQAAAGRDLPGAVQATVEGLVLGAYRFDRYKSDEGREGPHPGRGARVGAWQTRRRRARPSSAGRSSARPSAGRATW